MLIQKLSVCITRNTFMVLALCITGHLSVKLSDQRSDINATSIIILHSKLDCCNYQWRIQLWADRVAPPSINQNLGLVVAVRSSLHQSLGQVFI